jgi:uncharacterized protein
VSVYLDASFLVSLYVLDAFSERARTYLITNAPVVVISDFAAAEFASAVSKRVRVRQMTGAEGRRSLSTFDASVARIAQRTRLESGDLDAANAYLRRFDLKLRTADAINVAIAQRLGAALATFDKKMQAAAARLGTTLAAL